MEHFICLTMVVPTLTGFASGITQVEPLGAEAKVINDIFQGYNRNARPVENVNKTLELRTQFVLAYIENLDEKTQTLSTYGTLTMTWKDEFLHWDPQMYNGTMDLVLSSKLIWLPELIIYNSADEGEDLGVDTEFRVSVTAAGYILWNVYHKFLTRCDVDLLRFPFDTQTCYLEFISVLHGYLSYVQKIKFVLDRDDVNMHLYNKNSGWDLVEHKVFEQLRGDGEAIYPSVVVKLVLKRKPVYFVTNVIIPSMFLSYLSIFVFLLSNESGEKISLQVTVVLSYLMLLLFVADVTPATGKQLPLISNYLIACQCVAIICLLLTIFIINIYHRKTQDQVPFWLNRATFVLSKIVCKSNVFETSLIAPRKTSVNLTESQHQIAKSEVNQTSIERSAIPEKDTQYDRSISDAGKVNEWRNIASVLDKCFFCLFFFIVTITNIIVLAVIIQA